MTDYDEILNWIIRSLGIPPELAGTPCDSNYASAKVAYDLFLVRIGRSVDKERVNDQW